MVKELSGAQKKEWAKLLYKTDANITQKEIAAKVVATENTIGKWIKDEGWEQLRQSHLQSRDAQLFDLNQQWNELNSFIKKKKAGERFPDVKEADILIKISASIKNLQTEVDLQGVMEAGKGFVNFVRKADFANVQLAAKLFDGYIKSLLK
jgi:hypothetical protein